MDELWNYLGEIAEGFWGIVGEMSPYLLFGFLVAGVLNVLISPMWVERHLGGRGLWPVVKASAFGVPLPLCSCGVIPVAASLRRHGAGRGATTAFLISTPQTGVDSIVVTFSLLGPIYTVFRPIVALISGILGGGVVGALESNHEGESHATDCHDACCEGRQRPWPVRILHYGFVVLARDIGWALLLGLIAAALITALVPDDFFAAELGGVMTGGIGAMLIMMAIGIPVYVCATASVPVAAALIIKGVSPGAAMAFLMTGPATNAATIATVWKTMGRRTALVYLVTVAVTAVASGLLLDALFEAADVNPKPATSEMLPQWLKIASAVTLLGVMVHALLRPHGAHEDEALEADHNHESKELALTVGGMTCSHCADTVRRALLGCRGVDSARVDLKSGAAIVHGEANLDELRRSVESLGYTVVDANSDTAE